jgi:hypothetical protein
VLWLCATPSAPRGIFDLLIGAPACTHRIMAVLPAPSVMCGAIRPGMSQQLPFSLVSHVVFARSGMQMSLVLLMNTSLLSALDETLCIKSLCRHQSALIIHSAFTRIIGYLSASRHSRCFFASSSNASTQLPACATSRYQPEQTQQ